jgi:peptide/nickel transport system permease protein
MKLRTSMKSFLRQSMLARVGFAIVILLVFAALFAPWISPSDPASQNLSARLEGPSFSHWMGTDELGRDILSRVLYGARISLFVAACVVLGCGLTGLALGVLAGYRGGAFDRVVNLLLINAFLSFPGVLLAISFAAFFGPGIGKVILALIITGWAGYARLARAQVLKAKELEFVLAARSLGAPHIRIMLRHLLPNILQPVLIQATIGIAGAILAEATLSFLGLGVLAPLPSWGAMLNDARSHLFDAPHMVVFPALAVLLSVLAFNLIGDAWRDWLDPRTRSQMTALEQSRN